MSEGREVGVWVIKVKRLGSTNWCLQNSHRDVDCSMENIVHNIEIMRYGPGGYPGQ